MHVHFSIYKDASSNKDIIMAMVIVWNGWAAVLFLSTFEVLTSQIVW